MQDFIVGIFFIFFLFTSISSFLLLFFSFISVKTFNIVDHTKDISSEILTTKQSLDYELKMMFGKN